MVDIPVVLFVYRRPETLRRVLESLRADRVPLLYVFSDGPESAKTADDVAAVRRLVDTVDWCRCIVSESPINLGLGISVQRGVTSILQAHDCAIFYEDDLISVPGTYAYLCAALRHYENVPSVRSVTGWTHPLITPASVGTAPYFDGKGECWVWGTWARAWGGMDKSAVELMHECEAKGIDIERYGRDMPKMAREAERRNLWAVGWWYHHMLYSGLCLRPPWSLVEHIGWDSSRSTTANPEMLAWANPPLRECPPVPSDWPSPGEHRECMTLWRQAIDS